MLKVELDTEAMLDLLTTGRVRPREGDTWAWCEEPGWPIELFVMPPLFASGYYCIRLPTATKSMHIHLNEEGEPVHENVLGRAESKVSAWFIRRGHDEA